MVLREQQEEVLRAQVAALEKGRENPGDPTSAVATGDPMTVDEQKVPDEVAEEEEVARYGSKIIVIHPGSQNLRLGFASDALPKSIPNVIARREEKAEFEVEERCPKRVKLDADGDVDMDDDDEEVVGAVEKDREVYHPSVVRNALTDLETV
jgi:actin-related protein 8